jgi:hypothetical protein
VDADTFLALGRGIVDRLSSAERGALAARLGRFHALGLLRLAVFADALGFVRASLRDRDPDPETAEVLRTVEALRLALAEALGGSMKTERLSAIAEVVAPPSAVTATAQIILRASVHAVSPGSTP